jgi:outer membrane protein assembly factor BamB
MTWFAHTPPRREVDALLDYWDEVIDRRRIVPVPPSAVPAQLGAVVRTLQAAEIADPGAFAGEDRLLSALLARQREITSMNTTTATTVLSPPRKAPSLAIPGLPSIPFRTYAMPTLAIALVILLLTSAAGMWLAGSHDDDRVTLDARTTLVATPTAEAAPGWTHWRGDATRSGATNFGPIDQPVELWSHQASEIRGISCGPVPAVAGDTVYLACADGNLYAFARATGEIQWTFTTEPFDSLVNGPTIAGGLAYVRGEDSMSLYAVDIATGEEQWRYAAASVAAAPAVTGGMAFVNTAEGFLIGLDAATGEERWRTTTTAGGRTGDAAVLDGMAYVGSETGELTAVDAATGKIVWQVDTGNQRNASAVVADGIVYVGAGSPTGSLSAYDAETGVLRWQRDEPMITPSVANGVGYSVSDEGTVYAFDAASGEELWRVQVGIYVSPVAIAGDVIYVASEGGGAVYALDAATGNELWRVTVDGDPFVQAAVVDGAIYVATTNGVIHAFAEPVPGSATPPAGIASPEASPATPETAAATPGT